MKVFTSSSHVARLQRLAKTADFATQLYVRVKLEKNKQKTGEWVYSQLSKKGPLYIKLGQFISTRGDLFDDGYL